jgi:hypothetical protein
LVQHLGVVQHFLLQLQVAFAHFFLVLFFVIAFDLFELTGHLVQLGHVLLLDISYYAISDLIIFLLVQQLFVQIVLFVVVLLLHSSQFLFWFPDQLRYLRDQLGNVHVQLHGASVVEYGCGKTLLAEGTQLNKETVQLYYVFVDFFLDIYPHRR